LMQRVKGIRSASAERFAAQGLTVNGQGWPVEQHQPKALK
jgi:hypothetical protein